jgi:hypothetical protein
MLKSSGSVSEAEVHDQEVERAVASVEGSLPFIAGSNAYKVIRSMEVNLGEDL